MALYILFVLLLIITIIVIAYIIVVNKKPPPVPKGGLPAYTPVQISENLSHIGNNWLNKNSRGLYEMYIEGSPFERGVINGRLAKNLIYAQEKIFVDEIKRRIPGRFYLFFLKLVSAWMNRNLKHHVIPEYDLEIYGVSLSASKKFRMIGPDYLRILNYHAAHDIGHALQYMNLVGCTSFTASGSRTPDGKIIHARNFDFYAGDEFCKEKIITFYAPDKGHKFVMITWGGLVGTVSGMNLKGIAITVNAAKSKMPLSISTPVTILVREMLQYASSIEEAVEIAKKRRISVSESFMVSSGVDNRVLVIEKTPYRTEIFNPETEQVICTNHFQSEALKEDEINISQINDSASMWRYKRVQELLDRNNKITVDAAVNILRDRLGIEDKPIGNGNELTVNQLLCHHSIIFQPGELKMWVAAGPFNLGEYLCYNLIEIFSKTDVFENSCKIISEEEVIKSDVFIHNGGINKYERFKDIRKELNACKKNQRIGQPVIEEFILLNKEYFLSYSCSGDYFRKKKQFDKAVEYYRTALQKEIPNKHERDEIVKDLNFCEKRIIHQN